MENQAIIVRPDNRWDGNKLGDGNAEVLPVFDIRICGAFHNGDRVVLQIVEVDQSPSANVHGDERVIGAIEGSLHASRDWKTTNTFELSSRHVPMNHPGTRNFKPCVGFMFAHTQAHPTVFELPLAKSTHQSASDHKHFYFDGDYWEIKVRIPELDLESPVFPVAWTRRAVPTRFIDPDRRQASYDWHAGNHLKFFRDASETQAGKPGAFATISAAIRDAESFIFIVDWSFQPMICLDPTKREIINTLGSRLLWKARTGVLVAIHTWHFNSFVPDDRNDEAGDVFQAMANRYNVTLPSNLLWRASRRSDPAVENVKGFGWTHHQKFMVMDAPSPDGRRQVKAFFGGLDMTRGRFDWNEHPIMANDPRCSAFREVVLQDESAREPWSYKAHFYSAKQQFDNWYNAEYGDPSTEDLKSEDLNPREPWHDVHAEVTGPVAWDFLREFVGRWECPTSDQCGTPLGSRGLVKQKFQDITNRDQFVPQWEATENRGPWTAQLLHSIVERHMSQTVENPRWNPKFKEFQWKIPQENAGGMQYERSIQDSYLRAIQEAERFIYIENQYFIGSGPRWDRDSVMNQIPEALVHRIIDKHKAGQHFHVYVVMPMVPEGTTIPAATSIPHPVRVLQWQTIAYMINALKAAGIGEWQHYLSFYFLADCTGLSKNRISAYDNQVTVTQYVTVGYGEAMPVEVNLNDGEKDDQSRLRKILANTNRRAMIYVHSKLMIVDDRFVILGSANINERSMAGDRDSEICVAMWPSNNRVAADCENQVRAELRIPLWKEHLRDFAFDPLHPESTATRHAFHSAAQHNYWDLWFGRPPKGQIIMAPFDTDGGESWSKPKWLERLEHAHKEEFPLSKSEEAEYILDSLWQPGSKQQWWSWESYVPVLFGSGPLSKLTE